MSRQQAAGGDLGGTEVDRTELEGGQDGRPRPCDEGTPGPVRAPVRARLQGGAPFSTPAALAQSGPAERVALLEVEEPLRVDGALAAHWDMGRGMVS